MHEMSILKFFFIDLRETWKNFQFSKKVQMFKELVTLSVKKARVTARLTSARIESKKSGSIQE